LQSLDGLYNEIAGSELTLQLIYNTFEDIGCILLFILRNFNFLRIVYLYTFINLVNERTHYMFPVNCLNIHKCALIWTASPLAVSLSLSLATSIEYNFLKMHSNVMVP